ncbi:hypothetical protein DFQ28_007914 [Apophysomyces sp. BC1034]|nr:hypothetical protein DFQ30_007410 [Apophysomyces sp. BC1015]KAG0169367.1 hypothetical protein DFQ29_009725 [Apophysomyces sp. BC1021]KAG0186418.1 hypothetical protein DFQ28_007914 [Apophysomyces sp. BC1034]
MKACVCVDYLSHDWNNPDLIQSYREIRQQITKLNVKLSLATDQKTSKSVRIEQNRLYRFQNALWRQMSRTCTPQLSKPNPMVHPSTVNWQKESDITWLYGPLYTQNAPITNIPQQLQQKGLKPVLKRGTDLHEFAPPVPSDVTFEQDHYRPWSKCTSEPGTHTPNTSVRFSPEIVQFEYLPESPVHEPCHINDGGDYDADYWNLSLNDYDIESEDDDDDEDDMLWDLMVEVTGYIKSTAQSYLSHYLQPPKKSRTPHKELLHRPSRPETPLDIIVLLISMMKSMASFSVTWVMYQSLLPFSWIINHSMYLQKTAKHEKRHLSL